MNSLNQNTPEEVAEGLGYSGIMLVNATSQSAVGAWAAQVHAGFLHNYLKNNGGVSETFRLQIDDYPFPISQDL